MPSTASPSQDTPDGLLRTPPRRLPRRPALRGPDLLLHERAARRQARRRGLDALHRAALVPLRRTRGTRPDPGRGSGRRALRARRAAAAARTGAGPDPSARRLGPLAPGDRPAARHRRLRGPRHRGRPHLARRVRRPPLHPLPRRPLRRPDRPRHRGEDLGLRPRKGDGVRFYVFDAIGNPAAFKREYRALLDVLPCDDAEKHRVVDECRHAYALNAAVFEELEERFPNAA